MKTFAPAICVLALLSTGAAAQTFDDLKKDGNGGSTDNILTYGMGYHQQRYSPLKQINKQTVKRLVPVWSVSLDNNWGEQAQPIIYNGHQRQGDRRNRRRHRKTDLEADARLAAGDPARYLLRCIQQGRSNLQRQGLTTLDAHVVAYDAKDGKELWKSKAAEWKEGYSLTVAPLAVNGVLVTGISVAEFGIRGFIDGWDTETGKHLWRRYTIPARGEKGNRKTTMPGRPAAARPGSPARTIPSWI